MPEALAAILEKAMAKDPAERYQTPTEVAEALAPWTHDADPAAARGGDAAAQPGRDGRRHRRPRRRVGPPSDPPSGTRKPWQVSNGSPSSAAPAPPAPAVVPAPAVAPSAPAAAPRKSGPTLAAAPPRSAPSAVPAPPPSARPVAVAPPAAKVPARPVLSPVPLRPAPAPARSAVTTTPAPAAAPPLEEEAASWDKLVSDTVNPTGQMDTAPRSGKRPGPSWPGVTGRNFALPPLANPRLWIVVGAATAAVVILIVVGVWIAIAFSSGAARPEGPTGREPIRVDPSGANKAFRTLKEAILHAHANDHIVLAADVQEDDLTVNKVENLTIESAPERRATWRTTGRAMDKLLSVSDAPGFHLKGITFDGDGKTHILVQLNGACPGLTLDALRFDGIKTYGLVVADCDGAADRPVVLSNLSFDTTADTQTAVYFFFGRELLEPKAVVVKDLTFGPQGVHVQSSRPDLLKQLESVNALSPISAEFQPK